MSEEDDCLDDRKCSTKFMLGIFKRLGGEAFKNQDGQDFVCFSAGGPEGAEDARRTYSLAAGVAELVKVAVRADVVPSRHVREELKEHLSMQALAAEPRQTHVRLGAHDGAIYLDLGDPTWRAVRVTADSWKIVSDVPINFIRGKDAKPLPAPVRGGNLGRLWDLVNVTDEHDRVLVLSWLVATLYPLGPLTGLSIVGNAGSAKTTALHFLRGLIDPSVTDDRGLPRDEHALAIAASRNWVLSFDNLSGIAHWLSDALARVTTGGSFGDRTKYSNDSETTFKFRRPFLVNGIVDFAERPDLAQRCINVRLSPIKVRRTESEIYAEYERERPRLLGCLLDAVALGMASPPIPADLPRMADFAAFILRASPALGHAPAKFIEAYQGNLDDSSAAILDSDELVPVIQKLLDKHKGTWAGTAAELHTTLLRIATNPHAVPKGPRAISAALNRLEDILLKRCKISIVRPPRSSKSRGLILTTATK
mgnify:FL=1